MSSAEEKEMTQGKGQGRKSALKAGSPGAGAGGSPVPQPPAKAARVGADVFPPVEAFPFGGGGSSPGSVEGSVPGAGGSGAGSAGAPPGFVAAEVGRLGGGGVGALGVEGGGLERADGHPAGHGVTQERAVEEEQLGKGGPWSEGKFGKGGSQEAGFRGGADPWGGWRGEGLNGQVPILESPPGFADKQFGKQWYTSLQETGFQGDPGSKGQHGKGLNGQVYPPRPLSLEDLFAEVQAGNTNVNDKFAVLQTQFSTVQSKLEKLEAEGLTVHTKQFESLQVEVESVQARLPKWRSVSVPVPSLQISSRCTVS